VIDVYDALTSDRPYRMAWTHEEALAYIDSQAGVQFDPVVVRAFLEHTGTVGYGLS
jgi:HD-GYP domain-containing protein (c-di-GMP phosphodiesterase class II)